MVRHVGGHGLRDTPAKGRRGTHGVDAEDQEAGADPFPYNGGRSNVPCEGQPGGGQGAGGARDVGGGRTAGGATRQPEAGQGVGATGEAEGQVEHSETAAGGARGGGRVLELGGGAGHPAADARPASSTEQASDDRAEQSVWGMGPGWPSPNSLGFSPSHGGMMSPAANQMPMMPPMMQPMMGPPLQDLAMRLHGVEQELHAHRGQHSVAGYQLGVLHTEQARLQDELAGLQQEVLGQQEVQQAELAAAAKLGGAATLDDLQKLRTETMQAIAAGEQRWRKQIQQLGDGGDMADATMQGGAVAGVAARMEQHVAEKLHELETSITKLVAAKIDAQDAAWAAKLSAQDAAWTAMLTARDAEWTETLRGQLLQIREPLQGLQDDMQAAASNLGAKKTGQQPSSWGSRCSSVAENDAEDREISLLGGDDAGELVGLRLRMDVQEARIQVQAEEGARRADKERKDNQTQLEGLQERVRAMGGECTATMERFAEQLQEHVDQLVGHNERLQVHDVQLARLEDKSEGQDARGLQAGGRASELERELAATRAARDGLPAECGAQAREALEEAVQKLTTQLHQAQRAGSPEGLLERLMELETRVGDVEGEDQGAQGNVQVAQLTARVEQIEAWLEDSQNQARQARGRSPADEAFSPLGARGDFAPGWMAAGGGRSYQSPPEKHRLSAGGCSVPGVGSGFGAGRGRHRTVSRQDNMSRFGSPGPAGAVTSSNSLDQVTCEELRPKFTAQLKNQGQLSRCRLTTESVERSTSDKDHVTLLDFFRTCEAAAASITPPFDQWDGQARLQIIGDRIDPTFTAACEVLQRAKDEGWDYKRFKVRLTAEVAPELRARCKRDLDELRLSTSGTSVAAFLRTFKDKLRNAYAAGMSTGAGDPKAIREAVENLMVALGDNTDPARQLWTVYSAQGTDQWAQTQEQPLMEIIGKLIDALPPTVSVSVGKPCTSHKTKPVAQFKVATVVEDDAEELAELKVSYAAAAAEIAERFGADRFPAEEVMDCLGGSRKTKDPICPLCKGAPHTHERMTRHKTAADAWRVCPMWTASSDKSGSTLGSGAAAAYLTSSQRQGKAALRRVEGHADEAPQAAGHDRTDGSGNGE
jgi:hypothetical protein